MKPGLKWGLTLEIHASLEEDRREEVLNAIAFWLAFGGVLGFARWRTRSLWLPVGLHAGWIFANGMFLAVALPLNQPDPIARVLVGATLRDGLIPLLAVALAGIVLHFMTPAAEPGHGEG